MVKAKEHLKPDATAVYVAAGQAPSAIEEAIEAEIPLIVAVAEHIPTIDLARPLPCFQPGVVGIVARSGTLSYETVASTTRAGIGQSLVIGMGGDILPGTDFVDALTLFENHDDTKGIILVGEIGGDSELRAAEWIEKYRQRVERPKPIMALVAGFQAPPITVMGHAGAFSVLFNEKARAKAERLTRQGVVLVNHPSKFGTAMREILEERSHEDAGNKSNPRQYRERKGKAGNVAGNCGHQQRRLHTHARRPAWSAPSVIHVLARHGHFLAPDRSLQLLKAYQVPVVPNQPLTNMTDIVIQVGISRSSKRLSARIGTPIYDIDNRKRKTIPYVQMNMLLDKLWGSNPTHGFPRPTRAPPSFLFTSRFSANTSPHDPTGYLPTIMQLFIHQEAFSLYARFQRVDRPEGPAFQAITAQIGLDALVYREPKASPDITGRPQTELLQLTQQEEAAKDGIVYVKLDGSGTIGTLVNGAGLAMNTVDAVADLGGACANFLDTGGKATSATVKTSFQLVLSDPRVEVVFVNIFGGLTLCDMIAEGIMLAYKDLGIKVPVVVRLRGTNEEIGQKMIADSGLPLHAFDDFEEAALKAIDLARGE
ncbi:MAG: hypothetical protein Q9170_006884 [Blastenia crenularia]